MSDELKPCPFCGNIPALFEDSGMFIFCCVVCRFSGPSGATRDEALSTWNTRPGERALIAELEALTPGGSEFHDNPERCVEWLRERLSITGKIAARWIPVGERMPEEPGRYLTLRNRKCGLDRIFHDDVEASKAWWIADGITHWRQLPEPPKDEPK